MATSCSFLTLAGGEKRQQREKRLQTGLNTPVRKIKLPTDSMAKMTFLEPMGFSGSWS
jgi:hypothetical protein